METTAAQENNLARVLAIKSFSAHVMFDQIGASAEEATEGITSQVMDVWGRAGFPPGAIQQAAELGAELIRRLVEDEAPDDLEASGVSKAAQLALADQSASFLAELAAKVDLPPT